MFGAGIFLPKYLCLMHILWTCYCHVQHRGACAVTRREVKKAFDNFPPLFDSSFVFVSDGQLFKFIQTHCLGSPCYLLRVKQCYCSLDS